MPSGGARGRSGPPPDPNALSRDRKDDAAWIQLPRAGRKGAAPKWPLVDPESRELTLWRAHWKKPQAIMWEQNGQEIEVALYIRTLVAAEQPDAFVSRVTLVKQQQEALGLSLPGLHRNRWTIEPEDTKPVDEKPAAQSSSRSRFRVVGKTDSA